jgi:hypothetical protein
LGVVACLALGALASAEAPRILIYLDRAITPVNGVDPNPPLDSYIAQELDDSGKATSIVWGVLDPIFREAVDSGVIRIVPSKPTLEQAQATARLLKAEFLVWCSAAQKGEKVQGKIEIFQNGRSVLKDSQTVGVSTRGDLDMLGSMRSLARTWFLKMSGSILKLRFLLPISQKPTAS